MIRTIHVAVAGLLAVFVFFPVVFAEEAGMPTEKKVITKYQRRTYFDFEDTLIRGKILRPAGAYIYSRQHASFITKIKLKRSFMPELKSTGSGE